MEQLIKELLDEPTKKRLSALKLEYCTRTKKALLSNAEIYLACTAEQKKKLGPLLQMKPVRTAAGVSVVAVMTPRLSCPGNCIYCPQGEDSPKSYTGFEPASRRAKSVGYDPKKQVLVRLRQFSDTGHDTEKVDLVIMGGTFPAQDKGFQEGFIKECLDGLNGKDSASLAEAMLLNETALHRCTGLTIETRPDYSRQEHVDSMLALGCTRVELGVQSVYDEVLRFVKRGHLVADTAEATKALKDSGLKVNYHIMPGLPLTTKEMDIEMFKTLFEDERFRPDMLKIYPCLVLKGTELYAMYKRGEFAPISTDEAVERIAKGIEYVPRYVRIMRMMRDIPLDLVEAGMDKSHLTDLVERKLAEDGKKCGCIRCREAGISRLKTGVEAESLELCEIKYRASGGEERFISFEDTEKDILAAYLRLRLPESSKRPEIDGSCAIVRELRVVGSSLRLGARSDVSKQHHGLGAELLRVAEAKASEMGKEKMLVTSAIGSRNYYRKFGYGLLGPYMAKKI